MRRSLKTEELLRIHEEVTSDVGPGDVEEDVIKWICRFIAVSDLHVFARGFRAEEFLTFLKHVYAALLCINGDFIDFLMILRFWYMPQSHWTVIQKLLRKERETKTRKGVKIIWPPGNHELLLQRVARMMFRKGKIFRWGDNIFIPPEYLHITKLGLRVLIFHGDMFDGKHGFWEKLAGHAYDLIRCLERWINFVRRRCGRKEWQFSAFCQSYVQTLIERHAAKFNKDVAAETKKRGMGVGACGHTHLPAFVIIDGVLVINLGAWVDSPPLGCTGLIEDMDGVLALVQWIDGKLYNYLTGEEIAEGEIHFFRMIRLTDPEGNLLADLPELVGFNGQCLRVLQDDLSRPQLFLVAGDYTCGLSFARQSHGAVLKESVAERGSAGAELVFGKTGRIHITSISEGDATASIYAKAVHPGFLNDTIWTGAEVIANG